MNTKKLLLSTVLLVSSSAFCADVKLAVKPYKYTPIATKITGATMAATALVLEYLTLRNGGEINTHCMNAELFTLGAAVGTEYTDYKKINFASKAGLLVALSTHGVATYQNDGLFESLKPAAGVALVGAYVGNTNK